MEAKVTKKDLVDSLAHLPDNALVFVLTEDGSYDDLRVITVAGLFVDNKQVPGKSITLTYDDPKED